MIKAFKNHKKIRLCLFVAFVIGLTLTTFLLTPLGRSVTGWNGGKPMLQNECETFSGIALSDIDYGSDYQYLPALDREAKKIGSFHSDRLQMGNFSFQLGDFYLVSYYSNDYNIYDGRTIIPAMSVRFYHNGVGDGFGDYTPNFNLEFLVTAIKDDEVLFDTAFRFISSDNRNGNETEYYKASVRLSKDGKKIPLTGDNPPWDTTSAEMMLTSFHARWNEDKEQRTELIYDLFDDHQPDRIVISYAALRTQTATRVFTVYDKYSDSFSRNDYSIDDYIYSLAEEDDFGTRYIIAKNVDNVYYQRIAPAFFSEQEYKFITTPEEGENAREKFRRIFDSMVPQSFG